MVGGTQSQQHHQQQQPPPTQPPTTAAAAATATATATSAEEEALKRNTDCVYFLASPLTCKKGAECEYRHSDVARVNPRDCWFWLNANCLNPKCAFRHPPLDGLLGTQVPTPVGASIPPSQTAAIPVTSAPYNPAKQAVPCHFFQKGFCLKGDRCPFLHGPSAVNNKPPQGPAASSLSESPVLKKAIGGLEKCSQDQKVAPANTPKSAELLSHAPANIPKSAELLSHAKVVETAPPRNGVAVDRHIYPSSGPDDQPSSYRLTNAVPVTNGNSISRSNRVQQVYVSDDHGTLNSRDADEFSREPSPGFDVLVDDELRDSDYYPSEDHYERARGHEGRNLNPMNDYDIAHSTDYDSMVEVDRDRYRDPRGYDSYDHMQGQYAREQLRASSERKSGGSAHLERRRYPIADSSDHIAESDLRYRLSKQRRVNGLRSVISHDRGRENHADDRSYRNLSRRDTHHLPSHESAVSSRLRGRIKLPGRSSSPVNGSNLHSERETERGRNRGRVSPVRSHISPQQGRLRDRIKGMAPEDINNEGRSFRRTRETVNDNNSDFAGPKSLAELKSGKSAETNEASLGKRKYQMSESYRQNESDLSFEGPKPLGEISKRKKAAETAVPDRGLMFGNEDYASQKGDRESLRSVLKKEEFTSGTADVGSEGRDGLVFRKEAKSADVQSPRQHNVSENETEEGMIVDDAMEDHEPEIFDQRDGESDYEQVDGEDYNLDEAENAEAEEYLDDDDDGDDFAEKIGVMFS